MFAESIELIVLFSDTKPMKIVFNFSKKKENENKESIMRLKNQKSLSESEF